MFRRGLKPSWLTIDKLPNRKTCATKLTQQSDIPM